jgi:hypothetical protein
MVLQPAQGQLSSRESNDIKPGSCLSVLLQLPAFHFLRARSLRCLNFLGTTTPLVTEYTILNVAVVALFMPPMITAATPANDDADMYV